MVNYISKHGVKVCTWNKGGYYQQLVEPDGVDMDENDVYELERLVEKRV